MDSKILFAILIVIVIIAIYRKREDFDTYYLHDEGANRIYASEGNPMSMNQSSLYAKYAWSEKDPQGLTVYDKYYEESPTNSADPEYSYRDIDTNVYDSKFTIGSVENSYFTYGPESIKYMSDTSPATAYDWHTNELEVIAQKNY
jgi:hypothetical protein